jgi:very-short-patch-repair endonuclease
MVHTGSRRRQHARQMRRAPTRAEDRIWSWVRDRRFDGYKFKRQFPIGRYILDFYCPELKLAIEMDGQQHQTQWLAEYDGERSLELHARGIEVLRIPNELLIRDSLLAAELIRAAVKRCASLEAR